jgi:hypothetical protein
MYSFTRTAFDSPDPGVMERGKHGQALGQAWLELAFHHTQFATVYVGVVIEWSGKSALKVSLRHSLIELMNDVSSSG